jgi:hypothetical protein
MNALIITDDGEFVPVLTPDELIQSLIQNGKIEMADMVDFLALDTDEDKWRYILDKI